MRVVFVGTGDPHLDRYPPGGAIEAQVWMLAHELARRGHEAYILTRDAAKEPAPRVHVVHIDAPGEGQVLPKLPMGRRARAAIREIRPDVVYLSEKWVSFFPSGVDVPRIYATHNKDAFETYRSQAYVDHPLNRAFFGIKRRIEESEMRRAQVVGANSRGVLEYVRGRGMAHAELLPMAVDISDLKPHGEVDPPTVFASGQLLRVKGTHDLVEAFARVCGDRPAWRLVIGGRGPERALLEAQASNRGISDRVTFVGWQPREDFLRCLQQAAIFALPSYAETFGTVLLEAMACGKPVVSTDITGPRDIVEMGSTGILIAPGDVGALSDALIALMDDPTLRSRMGAAGALRARDAFTVNAAVEAFERLSVLAIEKRAARAAPVR